MNITIRKAELKDALCIVEAERKIAQQSGHFCSQPSELDEKAVIQTIQAPQSIYLQTELGLTLSFTKYTSSQPLVQCNDSHPLQ